MWKCKTCGCQNPDTCAACRMCKAAAPNYSIPNNTTSNFTKPSYTAPGYTEQNRFGHESAPKFCGRCGRQLEPGLTVCRYCAGAEESRKSHPSTKSNNNVVVIVAAAIVCIAAVLLLPRLLGGYQPSQSVQEPQTVQEPQFEQNPPAPKQEEAQEVKSLTSLCDAILLDDNIRFLGLSFSEVEQTLGGVSQVLFDVNGANRIIFEHSQDHRFDFGELVVPTEYWYTWTSEDFYVEYEHWQLDDMDTFRDGDDCDSVEISIANLYREWINQPSVLTPSMIETNPDFDPSNPEEFLSWVESLKQQGMSHYYGEYDAEFEYKGYVFRFYWLNGDGSFTDKTWCSVSRANG